MLIVQRGFIEFNNFNSWTSTVSRVISFNHLLESIALHTGLAQKLFWGMTSGPRLFHLLEAVSATSSQWLLVAQWLTAAGAAACQWVSDSQAEQQRPNLRHFARPGAVTSTVTTLTTVRATVSSSVPPLASLSVTRTVTMPVTRPAAPGSLRRYRPTAITAIAWVRVRATGTASGSTWASGLTA